MVGETCFHWQAEIKKKLWKSLEKFSENIEVIVEEWMVIGEWVMQWEMSEVFIQ